jgi:hypothetical protein
LNPLNPLKPLNPLNTLKPTVGSRTGKCVFVGHGGLVGQS